jgi:putative YhdH/YhfP family quinone oxidoreductase
MATNPKLPLSFQALYIRQTEGAFTRSIEDIPFDFLPDHGVTIKVHYSSLNYKDALSATGNKGVTQKFPHIPGVDASGIVIESRNNQFKPGDKVIVTSFDLGQNTPGGFGQYIRVPAEWVVPLPKGLSLKEVMMIGTSGFSAAYGVLKIAESGIQPGDGKIVVSGSTGAVGSFAVALLSKLGYEVTAITGKKNAHSFLKGLGASEISGREAVQDDSGKPLLPGKWIAAIDTVGGDILDTIIRQTAHNGVVTCAGNILGHNLKTSIYPFILRGVSLMGIDSGICLMPKRKEIWNLLADEWKLPELNKLSEEIVLEELSGYIDEILQGKLTGKKLIKLPG